MNQCKYCSKETKNQKFCSKQCQARYNLQNIKDTRIQFVCQKHNYRRVVNVTKFNQTKCPHCQSQKKMQSIKGKLCQKCGNPILEYIGTGRFCSRACANSRVHSEQTKNRIKLSTNKTYQKLNKSRIPTNKICVICGKQFILLKGQSSKRKSCSQICLEELNKRRAQERAKDPEIIKKISQTKKKAVINGTHKGWNSRKIISYPQRFFIDVLNNNEIQYIHNYKVLQKQLDQSLNSCFFLDFYLPKYNIDLEIDGKQHKYLDTIEQDKRRDQLLSKKYKVYRIEWNQINSQIGKILMKQKIDKFIQYIQGVV